MFSNSHAMIQPKIPDGYFSQENVQFIQNKVIEVLHHEYEQSIIIDFGSIIRMMERIFEERPETIPRMNQRVVMELCHDFRIYQANVDKHLRWEAHYDLSQMLIDESTNNHKVDFQRVKSNNRLGEKRVGGTTNFYFT